ncbi:hypothetical protein [Moorena sp. SIO3H5]|uniref:hypothetical protein n=1 Tax=Moorena sp. SIO3H5 TaxID=2607834 RepID=UPI0013BA3135|nr:hypothetical protein [Moorena sp. SIO3H5]NEO69694.1 hypothetical protein [Moorena sp. SIO3H5]
MPTLLCIPYCLLPIPCWWAKTVEFFLIILDNRTLPTLLSIPYSLFPIPCSLFPVPCWWSKTVGFFS